MAALLRAAREGARGAGHVAPNPLVGCCILDRAGRLLALGHHARFGGPHAEIAALQKITSPADLKGAHVFVTLEPCAHYGKTPPCAQALAQLPIASLTYGLRDPFPAVSGRGDQELRAAGKRVLNLEETNPKTFQQFFTDFPAFKLSATQLEQIKVRMAELAEIFLHNLRHQRPFVAVKVAASLDGKIAKASGESRWLTGEPARRHVHRLRAHYDAVLVGLRTFLIDNPSLNVRHPEFPNLQNKVVILDPELKSLPHLAQSQLLRVHAPEKIILTHASTHAPPAESELRRAGLDKINFVGSPLTSTGSLELASLLASLKRCGITSVLVEGGAHTISAFLQAKLVNRLYLFQAPLILGEKEALGWTSELFSSDLKSAQQLRHCRVARFGRDLLITARVSL